VKNYRVSTETTTAYGLQFAF